LDFNGENFACIGNLISAGIEFQWSWIMYALVFIFILCYNSNINFLN